MTTRSEGLPERVLQFGTGVFLLGFADWIIEQLNQRTDFAGGVVAFKARPGSSASLAPLNRGTYHVWLRGFSAGQLVDRVDDIRCLQRALNPFEEYAQACEIATSDDLQFVISNTTEAGIVYQPQPGPEYAVPKTFPALLTALLYQRFQHYEGAPSRGLAVLCCELIEDNATTLLTIVQRHARDWGLPQVFSTWLQQANAFCNTLVDRIVTGATDERPPGATVEQGLLIEAEAFHAWVIQAPRWVRELLPVENTGLDVSFVADLRPYRERKVRILNGAHTGCFALSLLLDVPTVFASAQHPLLGRFMQRLVNSEICPTLEDAGSGTSDYAAAILQRFQNPYVEHRWESIALNALAKWQARLLPVLLDARRLTGSYPPLLVLSLAATLAYYRGSWEGRSLVVNDNPDAIAAIRVAFSGNEQASAAVASILASPAIWAEPLPELPGLAELLAEELAALDQLGVQAVLEDRLGVANVRSD